MPQHGFASLLGVSWITVSRWEGSGVRGPSVVRLLNLERVCVWLGRKIRRRDLVRFFTQRHPLLLELRPIDLLGMRGGVEAVLRMLGSEG